MSRRVHMAEPTGYVHKRREEWGSICQVPVTEWQNPNETTRDPARVTCGHCLRILKKRGER